MAKWYEIEKEPIGTYHMHGETKYEPARNNNFELVITGGDKMRSLLKAGVNSVVAEDKDYVTDIQEDIRLSVDTATIPNFTQAILEIRRGNSVHKYAGVPTFADGQISCNDYIGLQTKDALQAWQRLSYDVVTQKVGRAYDWTDEEGNLHYGYKMDCKLVEYTSDYHMIRSWTLKGCWIAGLQEDNFDNSSGDKKKVTATFVYDYAIPESK